MNDRAAVKMTNVLRKLVRMEQLADSAITFEFLAAGNLVIWSSSPWTICASQDDLIMEFYVTYSGLIPIALMKVDLVEPDDHQSVATPYDLCRAVYITDRGNMDIYDILLLRDLKRIAEAWAEELATYRAHKTTYHKTPMIQDTTDGR